MSKTIVSITFDNGVSNKRYYFKSDLNLVVGDKVVLDTAYGLSIGTVRDINPTMTRNIVITKWVVAKLDMTAHEARLRREKRAEEAKKRMDAIRKEAEATTLHNYLMQTNAEYAQLHYETVNLEA